MKKLLVRKKKLLIVILSSLMLLLAIIWFGFQKYYKNLGRHYNLITISCGYDGVNYKNLILNSVLIDKKNLIIKSSCSILSCTSDYVNYFPFNLTSGLNLTIYNKEKSTIYITGSMKTSPIDTDVCEIKRNFFKSQWYVSKRQIFRDDYIFNRPMSYVSSMNLILTKNGKVYNLNNRKIYHPFYDTFFGAAQIKEKPYYMNCNGLFTVKNGNLIKKGELEKVYDGTILMQFMEGKYDYYIFPLEFSPDNKYLAFLTSDYKSNKERYTFYLLLHNIKAGTFEKLVSWSLNRNNSIAYDFSPIIQWCPTQNSVILATYFNDESSTISEIILCDIKDKKIINRINLHKFVKSIRWTPDGRKLGILTAEDRHFSVLDKNQEKKNMSIYIYDLDTRKLTKLMDCPDCFDFHFVE